jgi:hypothetical protein
VHVLEYALCFDCVVILYVCVVGCVRHCNWKSIYSDNKIKSYLYFESIILWLCDVVTCKYDVYCDIINCIIYCLNVTTGKQRRQGLL